MGCVYVAAVTAVQRSITPTTYSMFPSIYLHGFLHDGTGNTCSNGLDGHDEGDVCCPLSCGGCGEENCSSFGEECCVGAVEGSEIYCVDVREAPCIINREWEFGGLYPCPNEAYTPDSVHTSCTGHPSAARGPMLAFGCTVYMHANQAQSYRIVRIRACYHGIRSRGRVNHRARRMPSISCRRIEYHTPVTPCVCLCANVFSVSASCATEPRYTPANKTDRCNSVMAPLTIWTLRCTYTTARNNHPPSPMRARGAE